MRMTMIRLTPIPCVSGVLVRSSWRVVHSARRLTRCDLLGDHPDNVAHRPRMKVVRKCADPYAPVGQHQLPGYRATRANFAGLGRSGSWPQIIADLDSLTETEIEYDGKRFIVRLLQLRLQRERPPRLRVGYRSSRINEDVGVKADHHRLCISSRRNLRKVRPQGRP